MKVNTYNQKGEMSGTVDLPESVFGLLWNNALVWQVAEAERANRRAGTAHAKTRGEVRGGGKKPWRQKGTGRARHGSIRSPIWVGGGVTHGPRNTKRYEKKINKKTKIKALFTVLSQKVREGEILFMDDVSVPSAKTKEAVSVIEAISGIKEFASLGKKGKMFIALPSRDTATARAFRNIPDTSIGGVRNVSTSDMLSCRYIIMPKDSIDVLKSRAKI